MELSYRNGNSRPIAGERPVISDLTLTHQYKRALCKSELLYKP